MRFQTNMTQKGQVSIPERMRRVLGIQPSQRIEIQLDEKEKTLRLKTVPKITDLAGSFKPPNAQDPVKLREHMEKNYKR